MRSSTTIAEQLGHITYFELLKAYYADLSDAIIEYAGELYQYVGDEIIVSWNLKTGTHNNNCLRCFFAMKEDLGEKAAWYQEKFGVMPTFKAGIHYGKVTTGEIGVIKKDIFFTGDVLNTAARIQGLCNTYRTDLLISGDLLDRLKPEDEFQVRPIGEQELRGRKEAMELFTINKI